MSHFQAGKLVGEMNTSFMMLGACPVSFYHAFVYCACYVCFVWLSTRYHYSWHGTSKTVADVLCSSENRKKGKKKELPPWEETGEEASSVIGDSQKPCCAASASYTIVSLVLIIYYVVSSFFSMPLSINKWKHEFSYFISLSWIYLFESVMVYVVGVTHSYSSQVVIDVQCQCGICATRINRPFLKETAHSAFKKVVAIEMLSSLIVILLYYCTFSMIVWRLFDQRQL